MWQPAFFTQSLEGFSAHMNEGAERLIRRLAKVAAREQEIDIWRYLGSMTMDVVGVSSFGWVSCSPRGVVVVFQVHVRSPSPMMAPAHAYCLVGGPRPSMQPPSALCRHVTFLLLPTTSSPKFTGWMMGNPLFLPSHLWLVFSGSLDQRTGFSVACQGGVQDTG